MSRDTMRRDAELQPPFANFMGMKVTLVSKDKVEAEIFVREELNNRFGAMHGGAVMALADNLGGTATFANLPEGGRTATIESKTNFFAPIPGRRYRARRMHAAASRPHHHGLADAHHPQRRQAVRVGYPDADRDSTGNNLSAAARAATRTSGAGFHWPCAPRPWRLAPWRS